jgi:disulfide bond formation protein DsbB
MNPNPFAWPFRTQFALGALICTGLVAYAYFVLERHLGIVPCPKCMFQRGAFVGMAVFFLLASLHGPGAVGRRVYALLVAVCAAIGAVIAIQHLWMQMTPPDPLMGGCGMDFYTLFDNRFPLSQAIKKAFMASGDCSESGWRLLGITMPGWTLIAFVLLGGGALWAGFRARAIAVAGWRRAH